MYSGRFDKDVHQLNDVFAMQQMLGDQCGGSNMLSTPMGFQSLKNSKGKAAADGCLSCARTGVPLLAEAKFSCGHGAYCADCKVVSCPTCGETDSPAGAPVVDEDDFVYDVPEDIALFLPETPTDTTPSTAPSSKFGSGLDDLMAMFATKTPELPETPQPMTTPLLTPTPTPTPKDFSNLNNTTQTKPKRRAKRTRMESTKPQKKARSKTAKEDVNVSQIGPARPRRSGNPKEYGGLTDAQICDTQYETLMQRISPFDETLKEKIKERRRQLKNRIHARKAASKREARQVGLSGENEKLLQESERLRKENERLRQETAALEYKQIVLDLENAAHEDRMATLRSTLLSLKAQLMVTVNGDMNPNSLNENTAPFSPTLHQKLAATTLA